MFKLRTLLSHHNWYTLRAIAYAYGETFNPRMTKEQSVEYIAKLLGERKTITRVLKTLPDDARQALQALLICDASMPAYRFLAHFGPLPPFRPWRAGSPPTPWRHPTSPAERLWFLGLIFITQDKTVLVPQELVPTLTDHLVILDHSPPTTSHESRLTPPDPILDIAHILAFLQGHDAHPFAGRWLAPRHLRILNATLPHPDPTVAPARSELQTGYVRFLHYLAEVAGLVAPMMGLLKPTPTAWSWLDASEPQRWQTLWKSWQADIDREPALWARFRLPAAPSFVRTALHFFTGLPSGDAWSVSDLATYLRGRCVKDGSLPPDGDILAPLRALLTGPLTWATLACAFSPDSVSFSPLGHWLLGRATELPEPPATQPATVHHAGDSLIVTLPQAPARPPLRPLVKLALPPQKAPNEESHIRHLTHQRFISGLANGISRTQIIQTLTEIAESMPSPAILEHLKTWQAQAQSLTLRRMTILTAADPQTLDQLAAQRATRPHLCETLSPHHAAVDPSTIPQLLRALRRRDYTPLVESGIVPSSGAREKTDIGATAHLWLALRAYLDLADLLQLPSVPPAALLDELSAVLGAHDAGQLDIVAAQADDVQRRLRDTLDGYTTFPAPLPDIDHAAIQATVEQALEIGLALEIVYHTAGRGEHTTRIIEPLRLETRRGAVYLVAYCRLRQSERVFRLDRIESVTEH